MKTDGAARSNDHFVSVRQVAAAPLYKNRGTVPSADLRREVHVPGTVFIRIP